MKVLVTGGAGFIGSHVSTKLLERGDTIVILDDFNDRYDPTLKESRINEMFNADAKPEVIRADIRDLKTLETVFKKHSFDSVIHLAAWASVQPSIENPHLYTEVNVDGTVNILEVAQRFGVKNIVAASSSSVYGGITTVPFTEIMDILHPISPYAATKVATEVMCATWHNLYAIPITCLRFFTVYGPWGRPEMAIFKFTEAITNGAPVHMRGRNTQRDFTYIDDIVAGVIAALDTPNGFSVYNLGESDAVPLPRLIEALENSIGKKAIVEEVALPPGDIPATLADISKAQAELGYKPQYSIEEGVDKFVRWYQDWYLRAS